MNARVVTVQVRPGTIDAAIRIYRDSVVPAARQQKGFQGGLLLTDRNTGKGIVVSLWKTEADMREGETNGYYEEQIAKFASILAGPPIRESHEVSVRVGSHWGLSSESTSS